VHPLNGDHVIEQALGVAANPKSKDHPHTVVKHGRVPHGHAYTRTLYSNGAARAQAEYWLVHGAGHAWSGGNSDGSFTDPLGPDASGEMLRFFFERMKA
jgi:poly(3-hydroxybutyrate) depolymerase